MLNKLNKLMEEFRGCFSNNSAPDLIKAAELLDEIERVSKASGQYDAILKELQGIARSLDNNSKLKVTVTEYRDAISVNIPTKFPIEMIEKFIEDVRPAYIERFKDVSFNSNLNVIRITYKGLKDICLELNFDISKDEFMEYVKFTDDLFR